MRKTETGRDCLAYAEQIMRNQGWLKDADVARIRTDVLGDIDKAFSQTAHEPAPDPYKETWSPFATPELAQGWQVW